MDGGMADLTVVFHEPNLGGLESVLDLFMALGAIDLSLGHVGVVHEGYVRVLIQPLGLIVTGITPVLAGMAFALDDVAVAFFAGDMAGPHKIQVIESKTLKLDVLLGNLMTGRAIPQGKETRLALDAF